LATRNRADILAIMTATGDASDLKTRREALIREHCDAENRHDAKGVVATFARAHYDVVPLGAPTDGAPQVEELLGALFDAFPDFRADITRLHHGDDAVFADVVMTGTHQGEWLGIPASGRSMSVRSACIFDFEGADLVNESVYFDHATLLNQIGAG
jgi:steroid delta-isomerase-like uncharacterized protein